MHMEVDYEEVRMCPACATRLWGMRRNGFYNAPARMVCRYCGDEKNVYASMACPRGCAVVIEEDV